MPSAELSARNPRIRRLRRLTGRRSARLEEGRFVIEGPTLISEAFQAGVAVEELFVDRDALANERVASLVAEAEQREVIVASLAHGVLASVSDTVSPNAAIAVALRRPSGLDDVIAAAIARRRVLLVLADVNDPGNAGTLVRSAVAAGAAGVVACGGTDLFGPKVVRSSAGALFAVEAAEAELDDALAACRERALPILVAHQSGEPYDEVELPEPAAIVLGSEAHGVPPAVFDVADRAIAIPMERAVESLNVAMAGTILCFEIARRRRTAG